MSTFVINTHEGAWTLHALGLGCPTPAPTLQRLTPELITDANNNVRNRDVPAQCETLVLEPIQARLNESILTILNLLCG